jgi:hypothetical protein
VNRFVSRVCKVRKPVTVLSVIVVTTGKLLNKPITNPNGVFSSETRYNIYIYIYKCNAYGRNRLFRFSSERCITIHTVLRFPEYTPHRRIFRMKFATRTKVYILGKSKEF